VSDMDMEKPSDDAFEQQRDLVETDDELDDQRPDIPFDANEADAAEQKRAVDIGDDDYR
jgi:hypothetical protein